MYADNPIGKEELFNYKEMLREDEKKIKIIEEKKKEAVQKSDEDDDDDSFMSDTITEDQAAVEPKIIKKVKTE